MRTDHPRFFVPILALAATLALLLAACGDDADGNGGGGDSASGESGCTADVCMEGIAFSEAEVAVEAGGTIGWTNLDSVPHTVTAGTPDAPVDGGFDSGNIGEGESFDQTFEEAGEFSYFCSIHPQMEATVTVQ